VVSDRLTYHKLEAVIRELFALEAQTREAADMIAVTCRKSRALPNQLTTTIIIAGKGAGRDQPNGRCP
jgi:hypothetical protein